MKAILRGVFLIIEKLSRAIQKFVISPLKCCLFAQCGKKVTIHRNFRVSGWQNVYIEDHVAIGEGCRFMCTRAPIRSGGHVMFGPNVTGITGNHRVDVIGKYMDAVTEDEKAEQDDEPVVLSGDNWIGANAVVLKGVTVGQGAVIAAGAIVTKDVPAYSIVAGNPAKVIRMRFTNEQIQEHQRLMNQK